MQKCKALFIKPTTRPENHNEKIKNTTQLTFLKFGDCEASMHYLFSRQLQTCMNVQTSYI